MSGELQPFELIYVPRGEQLRSFSGQSFQPSTSFFVAMWCINAGVPVYLSKRAELVDEAGGHSVLGRPVFAADATRLGKDWEKVRHQHVHLHRKVTFSADLKACCTRETELLDLKVTLASPPVTVKQDRLSVFSAILQQVSTPCIASKEQYDILMGQRASDLICWRF